MFLPFRAASTTRPPKSARTILQKIECFKRLYSDWKNSTDWSWPVTYLKK